MDRMTKHSVTGHTHRVRTAQRHLSGSIVYRFETSRRCERDASLAPGAGCAKMADKDGSVRRYMRRSFGPGVALAVLVTTVLVAWFRLAPGSAGRQVDTDAGMPAWWPGAAELAVVRRPGPLAHTSVLREDTLAFLRARHRTSAQVYNNRLPRALMPEHYDIEMRPRFAAEAAAATDDDDDTFTATVAVRVLCVQPTNTVVVHAGKFNYTAVSGGPAVQVWEASSPLSQVAVTSVEKGDGLLTVSLASSLEAGNKYVVQIHFSGRLGDTRGFYKYHYTSADRNQHLLVTFFEPTFAREAFPCFDEPDMKATFTVVVVRPEAYHSISTMPLVRSEGRAGGYVADHFMTSVKMSTYTLAFMISNYTATRNGKVSVWTRPDEADQAGYAAEITPMIIDYFERLLDVPYVLPKIDLAALPSFLVDAMENWGLLTFHRNSLLFSDTKDAVTHKVVIATVISHELAHQWFGNLVTMRWWNDVWLNEGFASYMQYLGVDAVHPEWGIGPSIVRMMSYFLSPPIFLKGLRAYLKKYSFGNADQDQLFAALTKAQPEGGPRVRVDVKEVMDTWTRQPGYPVVDVVRDYEARTALLTQRHHCVRPDESRFWIIPITYTDAEHKNFTNTETVMWMKTKKAMLQNLPEKNEWIIVNLQSAGYYKVNYDVENWELLRRQLLVAPEVIPVLNRAQLIQDASDLAHSGDLSYAVAMDILDYVRRETAYAPLKTSLNTVEALDGRLRATDFYGKWQTYMKGLLKFHFDRLHWEARENESMPGKMIRKDVVFWSCQYNYQPCIEKCLRNFKAFMNSPLLLKDALRRDLTGTLVTLCHGIRLGDNTDWRFLADHIRDASSAEEAHVIVSALGCTGETKNLLSLLSFSMRNMTSLNKNMESSVGYFFESASYSNKGSDLTLKFFIENWKALLDKYGQSPSLKDTIWFAIQGIRKSEDLKQMEHFLATNVESKKTGKKLTRTFQTALDLARANINWVRKNARVIENWLDNKLAHLDDEGANKDAPPAAGA
ncbi:aminopeptidase N isoform X1 [Rhipicephalus microplus]|uniref:aminopeptidase N isoform X1 n=1 Tax=Rhipicephalus microplus TaxID=6941 RepID=UPI003F6C2B0A